MSNTIPTRAPHTTALIDWLTAQTQIPVGKGEKPTGAGWQGDPGVSEFVPYLVVHSIPGGSLDGPIGDPHADADLVWQVNAIGGDQLQAEMASDRARSVLLIGGLPPLAIDDRAVMWIRTDVAGGAARQDPDQPATWFAFDRYRLGTTPIT